MRDYTAGECLAVRASDGAYYAGGENEHIAMPELVQYIRRRQCRLAVIELGKGDLRIGVDERLLVDPPHPLQCADIEGSGRKADRRAPQ